SAKRDGVEPGSATANELAARHRANIERFYDCSDDMHRCLGDMYVEDERFGNFYNDAEPGLAQWVRDIIVASIER
ncbi:TipAS antibiotic-recognition domain-containing protein, partial [Mycolicibacterium pulveris]